MRLRQEEKHEERKGKEGSETTRGNILITCVSSDRGECRYEIEKKSLLIFTHLGRCSLPSGCGG